MTAEEFIGAVVLKKHQPHAEVVVVNGRQYGETRILKPEDEVPTPDDNPHLDVYIRIEGVL